MESMLAEVSSHEWSQEDTMQGMAADCHQQQFKSRNGSVSNCEIFCAAMANLIFNEPILELPASIVSTEIAFIANRFYTREPALDPHPPK